MCVENKLNYEYNNFKLKFNILFYIFENKISNDFRYYTSLKLQIFNQKFNLEYKHFNFS